MEARRVRHGDGEGEREPELPRESDRDREKSVPTLKSVAFTYALWNCAAMSMSVDTERPTRFTIPSSKACISGIAGSRLYPRVRARPRDSTWPSSLDVFTDAAATECNGSSAAETGMSGHRWQECLISSGSERRAEEGKTGDSDWELDLKESREEEGVVRAVDTELRLPKENQEFERVTVDTDEEIADLLPGADDADCMPSEHAAHSRPVASACMLARLDLVSSLALPFTDARSSSWSSMPNKLSRSSRCDRLILAEARREEASSEGNNGPCMLVRTSAKRTVRLRLCANSC